MGRQRREILTEPWHTQCECLVTLASTKSLCSCTDWFYVPAGTRRPDVPVCGPCLNDRHKA